MKEVLEVQLFSLKEVGEMLGVQPQTISKYIQQGKIQSRTIGGAKYISADNLKAYLQGAD